jgi:hypothetical protein
MWTCIVTNFFIIKPTICTNFKNLFRHETLHDSGSSSAHHQAFIHCTFVTGICNTSWSCSKAVYIPVWHIPLPSVQWMNSWWWAEELSETCRVHAGVNLGNWWIWFFFNYKGHCNRYYSVHIFSLTFGFCWHTKPKHFFFAVTQKTIKILSKQSKFIIVTSQWSAFLAEEDDKSKIWIQIHVCINV